MDDKKIKVSVLMLSYNHEKYIRQAIQSVVEQKTNFKFEVLIHDDASTDSSADIIREYEKEYPGVVKGIYQTENQLSKGISISFQILSPLIKGEYIAVCECDDYWTDDSKLQLQADFLDAHPEFSCVAHRFAFVDENGDPMNCGSGAYIEYEGDYVYTITDLKNDKLPNQTATKMYRNFYKALSEHDRETFLKSKLVGDRKSVIALLKMGNIFCMDRTMSAYRLSFSNGSWTSRHNNINTYKIHFDMYDNMESLGRELLNCELNYKRFKDRMVCFAFFTALIRPTKQNREIFLNIFKRSEKRFSLCFHIVIKSFLLLSRAVFVKTKKMLKRQVK